MVNLCLTSWTSPKAPLPMTLTSLKSSVFIRHCPISADTSASKQHCTNMQHLQHRSHYTTYICWRRHQCSWSSWWRGGRSQRRGPGPRPEDSPHWQWIWRERHIYDWSATRQIIQKKYMLHWADLLSYYLRHEPIFSYHLLSWILSSSLRSLSFLSLSSEIICLLILNHEVLLYHMYDKDFIIFLSKLLSLVMISRIPIHDLILWNR